MANNRFFQWLSSDRKGQIVIYDDVVEDDGEIYVCFKDGSRVNENFVLAINVKDPNGKLVAEIEGPNNHWQFKEKLVGREEERWELNGDGERVCIQPFIEGKKITELIPPRPSHSKFGELKRQEQPVIQNDISIIQNETIKPVTSNSDKNDPVTIMLDKSKKIDTEISMNLTISLPSKELYNIIKSNFEDGDKKTLEYIICNMNTEAIKTSIKDALQTMYNNQYDSVSSQ
jgi:hypothetical protein